MTKRGERAKPFLSDADDVNRSVAQASGNLLTWAMINWPVLGYSVAGIMGALAIAGWAFGPTQLTRPFSFVSQAADVCPLPRTFWVTTWDSSEPESDRMQHKRIKLTRCDASVAYGTYEYVGKTGSGMGKVVMSRRMGDTTSIYFFSEKADGPGIGVVVVRPLAHRDAAAGVVWSGFELGHDCICGENYAHPGPFTSVPAAVTESYDVPADLQGMLATIKMQPEIKSLPEDLFANRTKPSS